MHTLSIADCLSFGWRTFKERSWFYISMAAIVLAISLGWDYAGSLARESQVFGISFLTLLCSIGISTLLGMGQVAFALRAHDAPQEVSLNDLWAPHRFWKFLGTGIAGGLFVALGFILLVIPAFIFGIMIMFSSYIVMDEDRMPITALKESARITKGNRWKLFGFVAALLGLNLVGFCALFVGILVTMPISMLATAHAFRTLQGKLVA